MPRHGRISHTESTRNPSWTKATGLIVGTGQRSLGPWCVCLYLHLAYKWKTTKIDHRGFEAVSTRKRTDWEQVRHCPGFQRKELRSLEGRGSRRAGGELNWIEMEWEVKRIQTNFQWGRDRAAGCRDPVVWTKPSTKHEAQQSRHQNWPLLRWQGACATLSSFSLWLGWFSSLQSCSVSCPRFFSDCAVHLCSVYSLKE